jgi:hypothetical protein
VDRRLHRGGGDQLLGGHGADEVFGGHVAEVSLVGHVAEALLVRGGESISDAGHGVRAIAIGFR